MAEEAQLDLSRLLFLVAVAVGITLVARWWVIEPIYIASASMEPTLLTGVSLVNDKLTLKLRRPRRGDIIVFRPPEGGTAADRVKRVIAVGGETVELREKKVLIDGKYLDEPYAVHKRKDERLEGDSLGPLVVPKGCLFVLGDNRDESKDSSVWKDPFLKLDDVDGLVRGLY